MSEEKRLPVLVWMTHEEAELFREASPTEEGLALSKEIESRFYRAIRAALARKPGEVWVGQQCVIDDASSLGAIE